MSQAWNFWYHVTSNTKSTWLPGDPRGYRTRRHCEHIEGDYRHPPPPGSYESVRARSHSLLKSPPVVLTFEQCVIVCRTMAEAFEFHRIWFADIAVGRNTFIFWRSFHLIEPWRTADLCSMRRGISLASPRKKAPAG